MQSGCISSHTGKPRSCYDSRKEAQSSAEYMFRKKGLRFYPYKCNKCGFYHLGLEDDRINWTKGICGCTDSNGNLKNLYDTYEDAEKAKSRWEKRCNVVLEIYKCPECDGWHLTHIKSVGAGEGAYFQRAERRSGCLGAAACFVVLVGLAAILL